MLKLLWQTCCFEWTRLSFFQIVIKVTITLHKQRKFLLFWMPLRRTSTFWWKIDNTHSYWPKLCFLIIKQIGLAHERQRNIIQDCYMNCCMRGSRSPHHNTEQQHCKHRLSITKSNQKHNFYAFQSRYVLYLIDIQYFIQNI